MKTNWAIDILMIFSSIGVINSIYFIILLLKEKKGNKLLNKMLAILILAFTIRIGKSVVFYFSDEVLESTIINIGFFSLLLVGPSFYIYTLLFTRRIYQLKSKHLIHILPAFLLLLFSWAIPYNPATIYWRIGYCGILLQKLSYLILAIFLYFSETGKAEKEITDKKKSWFCTLIFSVFIVWLAYFLHFPVRLGSYINGAIAYTFIIYFASYQWNVLNKKGKHLHDLTGRMPESQEQNDFYTQVCQHLEKLLQEENYYKMPDVTLNLISKKLNIQSYLLSRIINSRYQKNFNDFINDYRISDAKKMLSHPDYTNLTIASIAYEVGFNSLSSFNDAFKKREKKTPSKFRSEQLLKKF